MQELVVISGKGGTGKTSLAASFAVLADRPVIADCDVDAADLHLVLSPQIKERHEFRSGHEAVIRQDDCTGCGACLAHCRVGAVLTPAVQDEWRMSGRMRMNCSDCAYCERSCDSRTNAIIGEMREALGKARSAAYAIDPIACEGCGVCVRFCPEKAIDFPERISGEWMVSETRCGPMVHARLGVAAENSGKLVSLVRREARRIAESANRPLVIVDGPPGIGCPVIASVTGATLVLAVTEPTVSGEHDLERVLSLTRHFDIPAAVCVNKWDLNPEMTGRIEDKARKAGARIVGRIRYDRAVTLAQMRGLAVVETEAPCIEDIQHVWNELS
ncbi:MAG: 4Fe-4S binding protein [Candidatus Aminicenantes bacterium]|nr:4Fe-4S binding protein [Candidatus Aminicenantes bacterium]